MGSYELSEGSRISFSQFASTMMACPDADFEPEFLKVFGDADNFSLKGDTLSLNKARMAPLARFVAAFPY
jgi:heat shock protein HslJ